MRDRNDYMVRQEYLQLPPDCYPDRMVECFLILDKRECVYKCLDDEKLDDNEHQKHGYPNIQMFLRRRQLEAVYVPNSTIFPCFRCGKIFTNIYSVTHHLEKDVCLNRVPSRPQLQSAQLLVN